VVRPKAVDRNEHDIDWVFPAFTADEEDGQEKQATNNKDKRSQGFSF